jgi:competence protein ComEC
MEKKKFLERLIAPFFIAGLFLFGVSLVRPEPIALSGNLQVTFLDVGQGDATLIKTPQNKYILVDGGPNKSVIEKMSIEMPPTVKEIEAVILTHPHTDHVAGLNYVLDRYKVKKVYLTGVPYTAPDYQTFLDKIREYNIPAEKYFAGKNIYIDELKLSAFYPPENTAQIYYKDINDSSIVFDLVYRQNSFLFLSDLSAKKQDEMLNTSTLGKTEVLKVSHHGSATGTSDKLLQIIQSKYAVIPVGAGNSYGLPAQKTLLQLSALQIFRTDELGSIRFSSDGNVVKLLP